MIIIIREFSRLVYRVLYHILEKLNDYVGLAGIWVCIHGVMYGKLSD